jgi:hypothetical protein
MSKPTLATVVGKFLHASQTAPLSPYAIQTQGIRYQDLPEAAFAPEPLHPVFRVSSSRDAAWGWGSYQIGEDGSLTLVSFNYDSSG